MHLWGFSFDALSAAIILTAFFDSLPLVHIMHVQVFACFREICIHASVSLGNFVKILGFLVLSTFTAYGTANRGPSSAADALGFELLKNAVA